MNESKSHEHLNSLVSLIWSFSMIWDAIKLDYNPPAAIHGAFTIVLGAAVKQRLPKD